jgi:hypothetical protein
MMGSSPGYEVAGCEYSRFVQDLFRIGESVNSWLWDRRSIYRVSRRRRAGVEQDTFRFPPILPVGDRGSGDVSVRDSIGRGGPGLQGASWRVEVEGSVLPIDPPDGRLYHRASKGGREPRSRANVPVAAGHRSGQVRFITRPKSRTMRAKRN